MNDGDKDVYSTGPDLPFAWFRDRQGNFFLAVVRHLEHLLGGG